MSQDKILEGSFSYNIYKELDNDVEEKNYDDYCTVFNNDEDNTEKKCYDLCKRISRNTHILSNYVNTNNFTTLCSHYRYWTYYNIKKILGDDTNDNNAKPIITKFKQVLDNIRKISNAFYCQYEFNDDIIKKLNDMKEQKYLYDYFQNYDSIKTSDTCEVVTPEKYEKYLNYIITLYNKRKEEDVCCSGPFLIDCEDYFKCDDEFDPNMLLSTLKSNRQKKCDNLIKTLPTLTSGVTSRSGSSLTNITGSIYYFKCTDIPNGNITHSQQKGGRLRCHRFSTSDRSHNNLISPSLQPPFVQVPFTISGQRGFSLSAELPRESLELNEHLKKQYMLSSSHTLDLTQDKSDDKNAPCKNTLLVRDVSGLCREPDVRETQTIGVKLNTYAPRRKIKIKLNHNSNMFENNFFRVGIALTVIVGIIFTIFLFYKFTPFGKCFHKKVSRKKRIDDYYDDPYMRQFIIRAPKYGRRKTGNRGLQFSYYSR
ncbi:PIR protein [Plasmodium malariae]|uniref:PIR protein n=1 Tax=Plasmodium malariae TaxID=5858 RepID=A0A1D3JGW1_PLAMA|nr:PIR protein [Plasmodium malariae]SBT85550.1 PIR protein [Plasmodium malariae]